MSTSEDFVVITGGPGAGKSVLIEELRRAGFASMDEAGRHIIQDQNAIGGRALHTADTQLFAEIMLAWEMRSHHEAAQYDGWVFFDRGVPDLIGYHRLLGRPVPPHVTAAAQRFRYHRRVFVAPPWSQIYAKDSERQQDFAEAVQTYDAVVEAYTQCGYELITLPKVDIASRAAFVRQHITGNRR